MRFRISRKVILTAAALLGGVACNGGAGPQDQEQSVTEFGALSLPLITAGESGTLYRLVNAEFEVRDIRTGRLAATLSSDDSPGQNLIRTELDPGNYTVTLLPGWSIIAEGGVFEGPPGVPTDGSGVPVAVDEMVGFGDTPGTSAGSFDGGVGDVIIIDPFPRPSRLNAALESDAVQFVSIFPNEDSFAFFVFRVGDNVISFQPGGLDIVFEVIEDGVGGGGGLCDNVDVARRVSVLENHVEALQAFSLENVLDNISQNEGLETPGELLYQQLIDSYASAANGRLPSAVHCGDEMTDGAPSLNGFPIDCDRAERFQFDNLKEWFPMAAVNRMDLAPQNGAHCGQQRLIFGNNAQGRMFIILEAQIPNPAPELGINGCAPLAEFWAASVQIEDAAERGERLRTAFLEGSPELAPHGFGPFATASNYTIGSGQIRTNNFDDGLWTLREFKLTQGGESDLQTIPFPVAEAPPGVLWNDLSDAPQGPECRDAFLAAAAEGLVTDNPAQMSFVVPEACKDAESRNDFFSQDYVSHLFEGSGSFVDELQELGELVGGLNAEDLATRAQFAGSCIGCHEEAVGRFLGNDVFAPFSRGFVHVEEFPGPCPDQGSCFGLSQGLEDVFLPHRIRVLENLTEVGMPPQCDGGGDDDDTSDDDISDDDTSDDDPGDDAGSPTEPDMMAAAPAAPIVTPTLPESDRPTAELVQEDQAIREVFGARTLGGQDARTSH